MGPQCAQPEALANRFLLTTKDEELCPLPSVSTFDIRNVTTSSVLIAWDSQDNNMTGLKGFLVAYHRLDMNDVVKKYKVNPSTRMFRLNTLMDNSVYLVCVVTQGSSYTDYSLYSEFAEAIRLEEEGEEQLPHSDQHVLGQGAPQEQEIPSSNDTRYLITKPIVLNLDSKSSRCNKIKTPLDPSKLRMIDNKQLSAIIGCSAGLMVFFCIIISIIVAKPKRSEEEDIIVPKSDSLTDSYKSPSPKSRSASIARDPKSLTNSAGSSLNRLNGLAEVSETEWSAPTSGTLKKRNGPKVNSSPQRRGGQTSLAAQSSTESGPSHSSQRMSRHSSSELSVREGSRRGGGGGSSEHLNGRGGAHGGGHGGGGGGAHHRPEMQRRSLTVDAAADNHQGQHTLPRGQQARARHELGRSGTLPPPPQRFGYDMGQSAEDCIPMIEYPDMGGNSAHSSPQTLRVPRPASQAGPRGRGGRVRQRGRGRGAGPPPHPPPPPSQSQNEQEQVAYYPQEGGARNGYIKYNSVNAARY